MELPHYIGIELSGLKMTITQILDGLTQEEINWRPASECNSIGLIFFHVARAEDMFIQSLLQKKNQIWKSEKWNEKLGVSAIEEGPHYTVEQAKAFRAPQLDDILAYYDAVRLKTKEKLRSMSAVEFDEKLTFPDSVERPTAALFSLLISHTSQHIGEISYLRGMQRGANK